MRRTLLLPLLSGLLFVAGAPAVDGQVRGGVVLDRDGLRYFHLAIGDHYGVPYERVRRSHTHHVRYDELPVVFLLAREAEVSPETVLALRARGWSWIEVTVHLGIAPTLFVSHLPRRAGPPYGRAHGYWRNRGAPHAHRLSDREVVDFVNVRFLSESLHHPVDRIITSRDRGASYLEIHASLTRETSNRHAPGARGGRGGPPGLDAPPRAPRRTSRSGTGWAGTPRPRRALGPVHAN